MNKIYKLVWSKAKNMWVVASELAKSYTKSPNSGITGFVSMASLESKINMDLSKGFVAGVFPMVNRPVAKLSDTPGKAMCKDSSYLEYLRRSVSFRLEREKD